MTYELVCLYIITLSAIVYLMGQLYRFVKADIPVEKEPAPVMPTKKGNKKKKGRR